MNKPLEKNPRIAEVVRESTRNGVPHRTIFADIQKYQNAPGSYTTFYKLYKLDIEAAKAETINQIGNKVVNQAVNGDPKDSATFKSQELYLRTQGGWTPKESIETREVGTDEEEDESAINALMKALGKSTDESDD